MIRVVLKGYDVDRAGRQTPGGARREKEAGKVLYTGP